MKISIVCVRVIINKRSFEPFRVWILLTSARTGYATEGALFYLRAAVRRRCQHLPKGSGTDHTLSIALRNLPPNSARFGYATERALFISAQLFVDAVSALRKVWVLI